MYCLSCKYNLKNLSENRCPECGHEFDPSDPRTYEVPVRPAMFPASVLWVTIAVTFFAIWGQYFVRGPLDPNAPLLHILGTGFMAFILTALISPLWLTAYFALCLVKRWWQR